MLWNRFYIWNHGLKADQGRAYMQIVEKINMIWWQITRHGCVIQALWNNLFWHPLCYIITITAIQFCTSHHSSAYPEGDVCFSCLTGDSCEQSFEGYLKSTCQIATLQFLTVSKPFQLRLFYEFFEGLLWTLGNRNTLENSNGILNVFPPFPSE